MKKKGKLALDKLGWLVLGVIALIVLVIIIMYFNDSLYSAAERFLKIFGG